MCDSSPVTIWEDIVPAAEVKSHSTFLLRLGLHGCIFSVNTCSFHCRYSLRLYDYSKNATKNTELEMLHKVETFENASVFDLSKYVKCIYM